MLVSWWSAQTTLLPLNGGGQTFALLSEYAILCVERRRVEQKGTYPMPASEERLTAVERAFTTFQKETAAHIREVDENTTIMLGVIRDQGRDIKRMVQHLETIDGCLDTLDHRLDSLDRHVESRFETLEKKFDQMLQLLMTLTTRSGPPQDQ